LIPSHRKLYTVLIRVSIYVAVLSRTAENVGSSDPHETEHRYLVSLYYLQPVIWFIWLW